MSTIHTPASPQRPCSWCAGLITIVRRPGRPRLYCNQSCRQRAYEHRHGLHHPRTARLLPGQDVADPSAGSGYEQGGFAVLEGRTHALRTSVRPEGRWRETLCGLLMAPVTGRTFTAFHPRACRTCATVAAARPLAHGIHPSNELARLRAIIDETAEQRLEPVAALDYLRSSTERGRHAQT